MRRGILPARLLRWTVPAAGLGLSPRWTVATVPAATRFESRARQLLARADVEIGGGRAWDIEVRDPRLYRRVFAQGSLGLGEAYMDGWWECASLDEFFARVHRAGLEQEVRGTLPDALAAGRARLLNLQSRRRAFAVGERHYDLGNDLYARMLDRRMVYSCAYWKSAKDLDGAQEAKLDLVCRKLGLSSGMRLLDIGSGWGSLAEWAATRHDASVVGVTVSRDQAQWSEERCRGLPVEVRVQDYRELAARGERFDRVASIGMFEHVGFRNYRRFMEVAHGALDDGGLLLLHTIARDRPAVAADPWIERYIFPNSMLPAPSQIARAAEGLFAIEDVQNLGAHYDPTLLAWHENFESRWPELADRYGERFRRMWRYYLLSSAGGFRARRLHVHQYVLAKGRGVEGGYAPAR